MSKWKEIKLGDTFSVSSGAGLPQHKMMFGIIPVYGGNGINGYHNDFLFEEQRIIIGRVGEHCGNVHLTKPKSWITDNALVVSFKEKGSDLKFWFYFLTFLNLKEYAFRGAQPVITGATIDKIYSKVPNNYSEQRKIARILSTADAVIEKTQAAIAKYKAIKQGMLHDLFTRGIDPASGKLRPTYEDAPHLYKESKLGWIPKEWEVESLGEVIRVSSGCGLTQNNIKPGIHPVYGGNGINGHHSEYLFIEERLIIGRVGEYCGNVLITKPFSWVTDNALVVTNIEKKFSLFFWLFYLNYLDLNSIAFAAAQPVITGGIINKVDIVKIPLSEQQIITTRLLTINNKIQTEQNYLHKMQQIKAGLMADLLSGKKKVNIDEEPVN